MFVAVKEPKPTTRPEMFAYVELYHVIYVLMALFEGIALDEFNEVAVFFVVRLLVGNEIQPPFDRMAHGLNFVFDTSEVV